MPFQFQPNGGAPLLGAQKLNKKNHGTDSIKINVWWRKSRNIAAVYVALLNTMSNTIAVPSKKKKKKWNALFLTQNYTFTVHQDF